LVHGQTHVVNWVTNLLNHLVKENLRVGKVSFEVSHSFFVKLQGHFFLLVLQLSDLEIISALLPDTWAETFAEIDLRIEAPKRLLRLYVDPDGALTTLEHLLRLE
jgi:hypothetical protein